MNRSGPAHRSRRPRVRWSFVASASTQSRLFDLPFDAQRVDALYGIAPTSVANGKATFPIDHFSDKLLAQAEPLPFWTVQRWPANAYAYDNTGTQISSLAVGSWLLEGTRVGVPQGGTVELEDYRGNILRATSGTFVLGVEGVAQTPMARCYTPCSITGDVPYHVVPDKHLFLRVRARPVVMGVRGSVGRMAEEECAAQPGRIVIDAELSAGEADLDTEGVLTQLYAGQHLRTCIGCGTDEPCCGADSATGKSCCGDRVCATTEACVDCSGSKTCNTPGATCCPYSATGTCPANQVCLSCAPSGCAAPNQVCCAGGDKGMCSPGDVCLDCTGPKKCYAPGTDCTTFTGASGEPCLNGSSCDSSNLVCCGRDYGPCSKIIDSQGNTRAAPQATCEACGTDGLPCCPGDACAGYHVLCTQFSSGGVSMTPYCKRYGLMGQVCLLDGPLNASGTQRAYSCDEGTPYPNDMAGCLCSTCGALDGICCAGGAFSDWKHDAPWCNAGSPQIVPGDPGFADVCLCKN